MLKLTTILSSLDLFIFTEWCKKLGNNTKRPSLGETLNVVEFNLFREPMTGVRITLADRGS